MSESHQRIYEELADQYDRKGEPRQRDLFLALAADAALAGGRPDEAERLRARLLQFSPHNLLRPFASFAEALASPDIKDYLGDLRRQYPPDQAVRLLTSQTGETPANSDRPVFKLQDPAPVPRARTSARSPYDAPPPFLTPAANTEFQGRWVTTLLFVLVLAATLALAGWTLIKPLWR